MELPGVTSRAGTERCRSDSARKPAGWITAAPWNNPHRETRHSTPLFPHPCLGTEIRKLFLDPAWVPGKNPGGTTGTWWKPLPEPQNYKKVAALVPALGDPLRKDPSTPPPGPRRMPIARTESTVVQSTAWEDGRTSPKARRQAHSAKRAAQASRSGLFLRSRSRTKPLSRRCGL